MNKVDRDDEEVLSAGSSPEAGAKVLPAKDWRKRKPEGQSSKDKEMQQCIVKIDTKKMKRGKNGQAEEDESSPPPLACARITLTGACLRHKNARAKPEFLVDTRPGKTFGGKYPAVKNALIKLYGQLPDEINPNAIGIARFAGWVRAAEHTTLRASCAQSQCCL